MRIPTIHLNGTGRETLQREYAAAIDAMQIAVAAVQDITVNGRDYYPQGDRAINEAGAQHCARVDKLEAVLRELRTIAEAIA